MSDFKVGDEVYFLTTGDYYIIATTDFEVYKATVCDSQDCDDEFGIGISETCVQGTCKEMPWLKKVKTFLLYKTKQECIDAFKKRLDEL